MEKQVYKENKTKQESLSTTKSTMFATNLEQKAADA